MLFASLADRIQKGLRSTSWAPLVRVYILRTHLLPRLMSKVLQQAKASNDNFLVDALNEMVALVGRRRKTRSSWTFNRKGIVQNR